MKRILITALFIFSLLACFGQGIVDIDIREFKELDDSLSVSCRVRITPRSIQTSERLLIGLAVESADSALYLPAVNILGSNKKKVLARFKRSDITTYIPSGIKTDTVLSYSLKVPYAGWMDRAGLVVTQELSGYRGKATRTSYKLRERVELAPREPYRVKPSVCFIVPQQQQKLRKRQGKAYLDFQAGRSVILPGYRRNPEELTRIDEAVREVTGNADAILQGIYIEGYASPEGAYATNQRLAGERAAALKEYIKNRFSLEDNLFRMASFGEDWQGLDVLVKASDMPQKEKVLGIIATVDIHDGREAALMRLDKGEPYRRMLKEMFPELRRVEYRLDYLVGEYDVSRTRELLEKNPGDLSHQELYTLAMSYGADSPAFNRMLLETIIRYYPEDQQANNNAAAVLILKGEAPAAGRYLEKAGKSPQALNNLGAVCLLEGDLEKAEEYLRLAIDLGCPQAQANLKELEAKRADNKKMERYFKSK